VAVQRGLLISQRTDDGDALRRVRHGDTAAEPVGGTDLGQGRGREVEQLEKHGIPRPVREVHQAGPAREGRLGDVRLPAAQPVRHPGRHIPKREPVRTGEGRGAGPRRVEDPPDLRRRPRRGEGQSGPCGEVGTAPLVESVHERGGPLVTPADRPCRRLPRGTVPGHDRLGLTGDPDTGKVGPPHTSRTQRTLSTHPTRLEQLLGVMLHMAVRRKERLDRLAGLSDHPHRHTRAGDGLDARLEHERPRRPTALIDRHDQRHHTLHHPASI
jgi:hypothetical protein